MELRILCKHLVADELNGKFTVGENNADIVGISLPRYYEQHDLSHFSFRIIAAGKCKNAAVQVLETDSFNEKSIHLLWNVTSDFTSIPDEFTLVLTGVNADNSVTIKFKSCPISVNTDKSWEFMPSPELSEQLFNQVQLEVQKANDAADRAEKASQTPAPAEIYPATANRLGGIKSVGDISVDDDGTVTVNAIKGKNPNTEIADIKSAQNSIASLSVQIAHPNNFLIYDDAGKPSVMVAIPKFYLDEVIDGTNHTVHPAFIINGVEQDVIYISKYQNIVENGRAYSLPMKDPAVNINFDQAWDYCKNKGKGWHLMTNTEWAAIALWCSKNGTMPKGNNNYGTDISETDLPQKAIAATYGSDGKINKILTGSGKENWYHDGTFAGIADLNGNVWEWYSGLRLVNREIQILENNNAADWNNSVSADSPAWKAIMPDGTLAAPGTENTIKYCEKFRNVNFKSISVTPVISENVSILIKALAVIPAFTSNEEDYDGATVWINDDNDALICRGGRWTPSVYNMFATDFDNFRLTGYDRVGFRCCYYGNI